jgi:hypothetical protein
MIDNGELTAPQTINEIKQIEKEKPFWVLGYYQRKRRMDYVRQQQTV